ncbi:hypothetical protein ZEAMMB73_Zm00001d040630 [Zea mays]|uniref:Uncharacterized protein n=1 Tax=Zea mays TaxID=4577 RepID=A0A1D6MRU7_MAIZE|nr:hypothetical protein ZEAMMB73_Zm00001d040630 [Zea mays]
MESRDVKAEQRQQQPELPKKRRRQKLLESAQASGGSSMSVAESSHSRTSAPAPPAGSDDAGAGGNGHQHQQGKRPRLIWTRRLHDLFVEAYEKSLGEDDAVPKRILENMREKMSPAETSEITREQVASHLQKYKLNLRSKEAERPPGGVQQQQASAEASTSQPRPRSLPPATPSAEVSQVAANLQPVPQLSGLPIWDRQAQPAEAMQRIPADSSCPVVEGRNPILLPETNTEAAVTLTRLARATQDGNVVGPEPAPACDIIERYWKSPRNEAFLSWDLFGLSPGK